jgi:hypothetical protein
MWPLVVGAAVWVWSSWWWLGVAGLVVTYGIQCWWYPFRRCWRCGGDKFRGDGKGNLRPRFCRVCKGKGLVRRWGAVLIGMVKP